jgi:hypothetical protein
MSRTSKTVAALAVAAIVLVVAAWFDNTVMRDAGEQTRTSVPDAFVTMTVLGSLLVARSVLLLGVLAWRSASVVVGLAYVVAGGFFAALPWLWWNLAVTNDVLLEALGVALREFFYSTQGSGLNAVGTIGAGMLIAGIAALARWWRGRDVAAGRVEVMDPAADPTLP